MLRMVSFGYYTHSAIVFKQTTIFVCTIGGII